MKRILLKKLISVPIPFELIEFLNKELPEYKGAFIYVDQTQRIHHPILQIHYDRIHNVVSVEKP